MSDKIVKRIVAAVAVTMTIGAPASAQIAKFHVMAPVMPGAAMIDKTSSSGDALGDFVGNTASMSQEKAASLGQMRDATSIVAGASQDVIREDETGAGPDLLGALGGLFGGASEDPQSPPTRPEHPILASINDDDTPPSITSRPDMGRQVIVRTRTKSPRGGSKIKTGGIWSVGEFR